ncbi:MAG: hypothetical protein HYS57_02180 [Parcubacteria group bacterium]|nr:hypothetical protein [Parcubacteria group bacterium]
MNLTNIVGYAGAVVGTSMMMPQVVKAWRTKRVRDLSFGMATLYFFNCALWLSYGLLAHAAPVTAANAIALVISVIQLSLLMRYRGSLN